MNRNASLVTGNEPCQGIIPDQSQVKNLGKIDESQAEMNVQSEI